MRILVYNGKHGFAFWMADTPARAAKAREALFKILDEMGCYLNEKLPLEKARDGDERAIEIILEHRKGYEYETWRYEEAKVLE